MTWLEAALNESKKQYTELVELVRELGSSRSLLGEEMFSGILRSVSLLGAELTSLERGKLSLLRGTPLYDRLDPEQQKFINAADDISLSGVNSFESIQIYRELFAAYNERISEFRNFILTNKQIVAAQKKSRLLKKV